MSETREQFRYRISQVAWAKSWSPENPQRADVASKHAVPDMAEAVYAQALRDVFDELLGDDVPEGTCCGCNNIGQDAVTHLAKWAAERGISLEDES